MRLFWVTYNNSLETKRERGIKTFSLVELVIVITILGVLASILLFSVGGIFESSYDTSIRADLNSFAELMETKALQRARERGSTVPYYTASPTVGDVRARDFGRAISGVTLDADAFCTCAPRNYADSAPVTKPECSANSLDEAKQLLEKYASDDVFFICETNPERSNWAAVILVEDNGALGDLGEASGDLDKDGDSTDTSATAGGKTYDETGFPVEVKIYCVSSDNASPVIWLSAEKFDRENGTNGQYINRLSRLIGGSVFVGNRNTPAAVQGDLCQFNPNVTGTLKTSPAAIRG